jgi:hypothetical protein
MSSEHDIELEKATRSTKRRALALVGVAFLLIVGAGVWGLFYLAPTDKTEAAAKKVQKYYLRNGVARAQVQKCATATDQERSLQLFSCKVSSRDPVVFDVRPPPTIEADAAYLCFDIADTEENVTRTLRPVRFFGIATSEDREICVLRDRATAFYKP